MLDPIDAKMVFILDNMKPVGKLAHENRAFDDIIAGNFEQETVYARIKN